jgi:hypothetical protein
MERVDSIFPHPRLSRPWWTHHRVVVVGEEARARRLARAGRTRIERMTRVRPRPRPHLLAVQQRLSRLRYLDTVDRPVHRRRHVPKGRRLELARARGLLVELKLRSRKAC